MFKKLNLTQHSRYCLEWVVGCWGHQLIWTPIFFTFIFNFIASFVSSLPDKFVSIGLLRVFFFHFIYIYIFFRRHPLKKIDLSLARPLDEMERGVVQMAETTEKIPLWIIGTVTGISVIGLVGIFFYGSYSRFIYVLIGWTEL